MQELRRGRLLDGGRDLDSSSVDIAEHVPPIVMVRECRVFHSGNETLDTEEVVDFREVSVGEGVPGEATESSTTGQGTCSQDMVNDFTRGLGFSEEDNALLGDKGIDEDYDWMCIGAVCGKVGM